MTSSSSAFSFHCMICFEEFDRTNNYPVVLPCGHTYVCVNCANRIDKCMECRAPLIVAPPPPPTSPSRSYNNSNSYSTRPQRQRPQPWHMREYMRQQEEEAQRERVRQQQQQQQQQVQQQTQQQQQSSIKKNRLPLPKNVVLLSLIQASEPARRRTSLLADAEITTTGSSVAGGAAAVDTETEDVERHSTAAAESPPQKQAVTKEDDDEEDRDALLGSPPSAPRSSRHSQSKNIITLPDVSPSLSFNNFIISNKEEEDDDSDDSSNNTEKQEDLKIQMGIGACTGVSGTYAVIDKNGVLVFRTLADLDLFEKRRKKRMVGVGSKEEGDEGMQREEGGRGVEGERVQLNQEQEQIKEEEDVNVEDDDKSVATAIVSKLSTVFHSLLSFDENVDGSGSDDSDDHNDRTTVAAAIPGEGRGGEAFPVVVDQQKASDSLGLTLSTSTSTMNELAGGDCQDDGTNSNNNTTMVNELDTASSSGGLYGSDILSLHEKQSLSFGLSSMASSTICHGSWDVKQSVDSPKKTYNIAVETDRTRSLTETSISVQDGRQHPSESEDKKINRQGGDGGNGKSEGEEGKAPPPSSVAVAPSMQEDEDSTFKGSYIRLKYGDRVQVVSFDPRGWVKLARGYGYIRIQNDKQLVKVGGPNDKACHIEATLHELSIERDRLKREQIKLERLSAGLMIDLQSTLLTTSDDHVICSPPKAFLRMSDSDSCGEDSNDGIVVTSIRFKSDGEAEAVEIGGEAVEITTTPTSSPRKDTTNQVQTDRSISPDTRITPTREVNWRTGMSGHMALSSPFTSSSATTYSHPHDFIAATSGGTTRSMSNHSGASTPKSKSRKQPRASIY